MHEHRIVRAPRNPEKQQLAILMRLEPTPAEAALWNRLRANRLGGLHFRRQQVIEGFIADFYCRAARLVIECDGSVHETRTEYDAERDRILSAYELRSLRFTNEEVLHDLDAVANRILEAATEYMQTKSPNSGSLR